MDNNITTESKSVSVTNNGDFVYRVRAFWDSNLWNWSDYETVTIDDPSLLVSLSVFSAQNSIDGILLNWTTESEVNNLGFILDRQISGTNGWTTIASYETHESLKGAGSSSSRNEYEFLDTNVEKGMTYRYRLSDVDINGHINTYEPISITCQDAIQPKIAALDAPCPNECRRHHQNP